MRYYGNTKVGNRFVVLITRVKLVIIKIRTKHIMEELTLLQALCLSRTGWSGDDERQLFLMAEEVIRQESKRLQLTYKKELIENELKQINNK